MRRGEIYLAYFPFGDQVATKLRPVLMLTGSVGIGTEVVAAYITSILPSTLLASDLVLDPALPQYAATALKTTSVLRLHKFGTIHVSSIQRRLGVISPMTQQIVDQKLRALLEL